MKARRSLSTMTSVSRTSRTSSGRAPPLPPQPKPKPNNLKPDRNKLRRHSVFPIPDLTLTTDYSEEYSDDDEHKQVKTRRDRMASTMPEDPEPGPGFEAGRCREEIVAHVAGQIMVMDLVHFGRVAGVQCMLSRRAGRIRLSLPEARNFQLSRPVHPLFAAKVLSLLRPYKRRGVRFVSDIAE